MKEGGASHRVSVLISALIVCLVIAAFWWQPFEQQHQSPSIQWLESLPAPSAGIPAERPIANGGEPEQWIKAAGTGEAWLAAPHSEEFKRLRASVTEALIGSERFGRFPQAVPIDLSLLEDKEVIKYLVDSRPGVMSVIYYSEVAGQPAMVVYWPEILGDQLMYTPIGGASAEALSQWVRKQVALATPK